MIVVIGTTTVDLFISGMDRMPRFEGDEFTVSSLSFCSRPLGLMLGGNGANSAAVLGDLGADVVLCSAAGRGFLGAQVVHWLKTKRVDLRAFVRHELGTATTTTAVDAALNRVSFYYQGAFPAYGYANLPAGLLGEADAVLVTGYSLLPGFRPQGFAAVFPEAKAGGAVTALDIGPAIGAPVKTPELAPLLPYIDYLITNDYELAVCTGEEDTNAGVAQLFQAGARQVVVKRGAEGASLFVPGAGPDAVEHHAPGYRVTVENNIGAGDAFNAGFLLAVMRGDALTAALRFGNATAAACISADSNAREGRQLELATIHALMAID